MQGKRVEDTPFGDLPVVEEDKLFPENRGIYWRVMDRKNVTEPLTVDRLYPERDFSSNLTGQVWGIITPNGLYALLTMHTVREEEDGTISIRPGDGSSNSVLVQSIGGDGKPISWHGYIEHGVWNEC